MVGKTKMIIGSPFEIKVKKEGKFYSAICEQIGEVGIASQGRTKKEAIENLNEAISLYLEDEDAIIPALPVPIKGKLGVIEPSKELMKAITRFSIISYTDNKVIDIEQVPPIRQTSFKSIT